MPTPEQNTQLAVVKWLELQYPQVHQHLVMINNDGKRTAGGHVLARKMGLHKGASDIFLAWPTEKYHGLWVELKKDKWKGAYGIKEKRHHEFQSHFIEKMKLIGYQAAFAVGVDEAIRVITEYMTPEPKPKKAKVEAASPST